MVEGQTTKRRQVDGIQLDVGLTGATSLETQALVKSPHQAPTTPVDYPIHHTPDTGQARK